MIVMLHQGALVGHLRLPCFITWGLPPPSHGMRLAFSALSQTLSLSPLRRGAGRRSFPGSKTRQGTGACSVDTRVSGPRAPRPILTPPYLPMLKLHLPRSLIRGGSHLLGAVLLVCIGISHSQDRAAPQRQPPSRPPHAQRRRAARAAADRGHGGHKPQTGGVGVDGGFAARSQWRRTHRQRVGAQTKDRTQAWLRRY